VGHGQFMWLDPRAPAGAWRFIGTHRRGWTGDFSGRIFRGGRCTPARTVRHRENSAPTPLQVIDAGDRQKCRLAGREDGIPRDNAFPCTIIFLQPSQLTSLLRAPGGGAARVFQLRHYSLDKQERCRSGSIWPRNVADFVWALIRLPSDRDSKRGEGATSVVTTSFPGQTK